VSLPAGAAGYREVEGPEDSVLIVPDDYDPAVKHPAVILLPFTGGTPADLFHWYYAGSYGKRGNPKPVLVLLDRKGRRGDYSDGEEWAETVEDYEEEIREVFDELIADHGIDPSRVALGGFSMGGDLGWALALRNPEMFSGVIVMGSRCNWREQKKVLGRLRSSGTRVAFFLGSKDKTERVRGLHAARDWLEKAGVNIRYRERPGVGHLPAPAPAFWEAVDWLFTPVDVIQEAMVSDPRGMTG
jgi:predicted esterase